MDRLGGEFTIACNRFYMLDVDWTPNWWILADVIHEDGHWDWNDLFSRESLFLMRDHDRSYMEPEFADVSNLMYMSRCTHIGGKYVPNAWHLPDPCDYGGSISLAIQVAASLGRNPIYLLGCDLYKYRGPDEGDINHFDPDYARYKMARGEEINPPASWASLNRRLIIGHTIARMEAEKMGITIYNASVGGDLEVYERADIWDVLSGK